MCFVYHDAEVMQRWTEEDTIADVAVVCGDCGGTVRPGDPVRVIEMGEYDVCDMCGCHYDDTPSEDCPAGCEFGREETEYRCQHCQAARAVIREEELAAGCDPDEAEPALGDLRRALAEDLYGGDTFDEEEPRGRYAARMLATRPDLAAHWDRLTAGHAEWERRHRWPAIDVEPSAVGDDIYHEIGGEG